MRSLTAFLLLAATAAAAAAAPPTVNWVQLARGAPREAHHAAVLAAKADPRAAFDAWSAAFGKVYNDVQHADTRFAAWLDNLNYVHDYNAASKTHWLGMNSLADLTHDEYRATRLGLAKLPPKKTRTFGDLPSGPLPESIDWRAKSAVTPVKNQAQCGSCWAFSTTGAVEGINAIVTGKLVSLSEQELVDCDTEHDHGCSGGLMDFAFDFILKNGGIDTEADYAYKAEEHKCKIDKQARHVVSIDGHEDVPPGDEAALQAAVSRQPVSVAIEADQRPFQLYVGGVFDAACGQALDHGVLAVGYGSEAGQDYWLVKNSWGPAWGDRGYIKLARNLDNSSSGQCGIAMQASYPLKNGPNPPPGPDPPAPPPGPTPPGPEPPGPTPPGPTPPPPPPPGPACDDATTCPAGATCCCARDFFGYCFTWACCPLPDATCCEDKEHCCPADLPVCDTEAGRCTAGPGGVAGVSVPWSTKVAATRRADAPPSLATALRELARAAAAGGRVRRVEDGGVAAE